jgi:murein DD-endopeptidase MepM/ murein hydrolase activator NlpD
VDIAGTLNVSPVYANRDGTVRFAGPTAGDGGWLVEIDHGNGIVTGYVHLQANSIPSGVVAGASVTLGQQIGIVGNTGNARGTPPHLHFRVQRNGAIINPENYLNNPC